MARRHGRRNNSSVSLLECNALETRLTPAGIPAVDLEQGFVPGQMVGASVGYDDGALILTDGPFQSRAALTQTRVDVRAFHTSFVFQLGEDDPATNWTKGEGFTFALASSNAPFSGVAGAGLGYQGLTESVAIKFDLVNNAGEGTHSVGVFTGGAEPTVPAVNLHRTGIDLKSGHPFRADIAYDGSNLSLTLTDTIIPQRTWTGDFEVDIPGALAASTGYVGFTAGTGSMFSRQAIQSWTFMEDTVPAPVNQPPEIVDPIEVSFLSPGSIALHATATDDGGVENLSYAWEVVTAPEDTTPQITAFSPGIAFASFSGSGHYVFRVTVTDEEGLAVTHLVTPDPFPVMGESHTPPNYLPVLTSNVFPQEATVRPGETLQYVVDLRDEHGDQLPEPVVVWNVLTGPGTIDSTGRYTAPPAVSGIVTIQAIIPDSNVPAAEWKTYTAKAIILPGPVTIENLDFSDGFETSDLTENGSASIIDGRLRLADSAFQAGSAYAPEPVDVRGSTTSFQFQVGNMPSWWHGDGLTFVLQNAGPTALGVAGGGLGYEGIGQSVAIKFDLVDNAGEGTDSVGVFTSGAVPTIPASTFSKGPFNERIHLNSGHVFQVDLSYADGNLLLNLRDTVTGQRFETTYAVDIPVAVGGTTAFVGFTAGTGSLFAPIEVLNWTYTPTTDSSGNAAPIIVEGLTPDLRIVQDSRTTFRTFAVDDGSPYDVWHTWDVLATPIGAAPVRLHTDSFHNSHTTTFYWNTTATFFQAGEYVFQLTVRDHESLFGYSWDPEGKATQSGPITVIVEQIPFEFVVTPSSTMVLNGGTVALEVKEFDQFGDPLVTSTGGWHFDLEGPGFIDNDGRYHAPPSWTGPVTIRATNGTITGVTIVNVVDLLGTANPLALPS